VGDLSVICGDLNVKPDSKTLTILRSDGMVELVTHHWAEIFTSRKMASGSYVRKAAIGPSSSEPLLFAQMRLQIPIYHQFVTSSGDNVVTRDLFAIGDRSHMR
jgi:hypothetical protein